MYGPITMLQCDNCLVKHIPWSAFKMVESDWLRVVDTHDILAVSHVIFILLHYSMRNTRIPIAFNKPSPLRKNQPSGVRSRHSRSFKRHGRRSRITQNTRCTRTHLPMVLERSESITLALMKSPVPCWHLVSLLRLFRATTDVIVEVLRPYYKLAYIKMAWGGPEEQEAEITAGNVHAKDWQDEARKIVEKTVGHFVFIYEIVVLTQTELN